MKIILSKSIRDPIYAIVCADDTVHDDMRRCSYGSKSLMETRMRRLEMEGKACSPHKIGKFVLEEIV